MRVYRVEGHDDDVGAVFAGTLAQARTFMKEAAPVFRAAVTVQELQLPVHKAALIQILNGDPVEGHVVREWTGTARGGLRPLTSSHMD